VVRVLPVHLAQSHQTQASLILDALQGDEHLAARLWNAAQGSPRSCVS
jgi:hypothetical protein